MNLLNVFTRKDFTYIFSKLKKLKSSFLDEMKPTISEETPYTWFQILDTTEIAEDPYYKDTESVLLNTVNHNTEKYDYSISFLDGKTPSMSITNARSSAEEVTSKNDVIIEILEE